MLVGGADDEIGARIDGDERNRVGRVYQGAGADLLCGFEDIFLFCSFAGLRLNQAECDERGLLVYVLVKPVEGHLPDADAAFAGRDENRVEHRNELVVRNDDLIFRGERRGDGADAHRH